MLNSSGLTGGTSLVSLTNPCPLFLRHYQQRYALQNCINQCEEIVMKQSNILFILGTLSIALASSLYANPTTIKFNNDLPQVTLDPGTYVKKLLLPPKISGIHYNCCGISTICLRANVKNQNNSKQTYKVKFTGYIQGKCLKESTAHCPAPPRDFICIPKCIKYSPPIKRESKVQSIIFAPHQTKNISIVLDNAHFLKGTLSVGNIKQSVHPPFLSCVR